MGSLASCARPHRLILHAGADRWSLRHRLAISVVTGEHRLTRQKTHASIRNWIRQTGERSKCDRTIASNRTPSSDRCKHLVLSLRRQKPKRNINIFVLGFLFRIALRKHHTAVPSAGNYRLFIGVAASDFLFADPKIADRCLVCARSTPRVARGRCKPIRFTANRHHRARTC